MVSAKLLDSSDGGCGLGSPPLEYQAGAVKDEAQDASQDDEQNREQHERLAGSRICFLMNVETSPFELNRRETFPIFSPSVSLAGLPVSGTPGS